ncbi:MAG: glycosyltransferase [Nitrospirales bacterium]|nr:glycosyltransferase [Nitrospira sp.]MDR4502675.1 glycosyltransferase [Nitrospirales bacterium]
MKILLVHNFYQQRGGEDQAFEEERRLLRNYRHQVIDYTLHNNQVTTYNKRELVHALIWNTQSYRALRNLISNEKPDIMHVHNTFPLISPSAYYAANAEKVPVIQTLHNFRLLCLNATFFRENRTCEDCMGKLWPWPGIRHACYRDGRGPSSGVATMLIVHRLLRTWQRNVNLFIALSEFAKKRFVAGGLEENKIVVKPNFVAPDPGTGTGGGNYALYVGRLSQEKGIEMMLESWQKLQGQLCLKIVGEGTLSPVVKKATECIPSVEHLGYQSHENVLHLMKEALFLVFPSECYENFPLTIAEAYAVGLPVVACNNGSMSSLVIDGQTGLHFELGNTDDFLKKITWILENPGELRKMRILARKEYVEKYMAEQNHEILMNVYKRVVMTE